jgi:hypothetical protein
MVSANRKKRDCAPRDSVKILSVRRFYFETEKEKK